MGKSAFRRGRVTSFCALGGLVGVGFVAVACSSDFDTSRDIPKRGTLGEELFGVLCDRIGAQALHEDLTGESFRPLCHKDASGQIASKVDVTKLPAVVDGAVDRDGKLVPLAKQQNDRNVAVARIEALAKRRPDLIAALDATFPDIKVAVKDNTNPDPAKSCGAPSAGGERRLHDELADMLGRFQDLYNDHTIPESTESLARVMNAFKASPDAQQAYARFDARQGYRPVEVILGAARPLIAYPKLRDLANATLSILSADSKPYDPAPKLDATGTRILVPGAANPQFSKLLEVAHAELRDAKSDPVLAPLTPPAPDPAGRVFLARPRTNLEVMQELFYAEDAAFGGGNSRFIVKRDPRGYAEVALVNGAVPAPFVDKDGDKLADIDDLGRFVTADASLAATPFFAVGSVFGNRDPLGRPLDSQGRLVYRYIDTSHTFTAQLMSDLKPLVNPDKAASHETLMNTMAGAHVLYGTRDGSPKTARQYSPDPSLADDWKLTHGADKPPPSDINAKPVTVSYDAFHTENSALLDLVYAIGQMMGDKTMDDTLALVSTLMSKHTGDLARIAGDGLFVKALADKHVEATLPAKSVLWDEMIDVTVQIAKEPGLLEDVLRALASDDSLTLGTIFSSYMNFKDRISYDRNNINGPAFNFTTSTVAQMSTPVDRTKPLTGANRSGMQKFLQAIHDTNGVTACNKEGAVVHARGIPILGNVDICSGALGLCSAPFTRPFHECEIFKIENLAKFYLQSIIGKVDKRTGTGIYFRPNILRNGIAGIGASTVDIIQQSSGLGTNGADGAASGPNQVGFWDDSGAKVFRPKPPWLNRLVFFDQANDLQQPTHDFLRDLQGPDIGSSTCPERVITDPDPGAVDASPDGMVHGLRTCPPGQNLYQRDQDATIVWEDFGFYRGITPLINAFANHDREDLFLGLMEVLHKHWADQAATASECALGGGKSCTKDGVVGYEPLLVEVFASDIMPALHQLTKTLDAVTVPHCSTVNPATHACTITNMTGIAVLAQATRALVDPDLAKASALKDRAGQVTSLRNDGTTNPQVTPLYLMLQALNKIDDAFAQYAASNPTDAGRQAQWKAARSQLVDQFLDVNGKNTPTATFVNAGIPKITPVLVDVLRSQLVAHCPDSFNPPYTRCAWARDQITQQMTDVMKGPMFATMMDLMDAIRRDDGARVELEKLLTYLLDAASTNDALASLLASASDMVQALRDDTNLTPLFKVMSTATSPSLVDANGHIVRKSMVDAQLALLARISGKAFDAAGKTEVCSKELDPNQILSVALGRLVTPMTGADGRPTQSPLEVILDVIADVNRATPATPAKLVAADYANIADNVSDFLSNKERGLEQFYEIVRQGTVRE